jgi:hypothetical protein
MWHVKKSPWNVSKLFIDLSIMGEHPNASDHQLKDWSYNLKAAAINFILELAADFKINFILQCSCCRTAEARGSTVIKALCYKPEVTGLRPHKVNFFSIYQILPATLGPGVHSASNRNEYQKQKDNDVSVK